MVALSMRGGTVRICLFAFVFTSTQVLADDPPKISSGRPLRVVLLSGSVEYESADSLSHWKETLENEYLIRCELLQAEKEDRIPGLERLDKADLAVFFTRRIKMPVEELGPLKSYLSSEKPILALRTASHGFQGYLEFDREILGGNYQGHYDKGAPTHYSLNPEAKEHPLLHQIAGEWDSEYSLYKTAPLAIDCLPLVWGNSAAGDKPQPAV